MSARETAQVDKERYEEVCERARACGCDPHTFVLEEEREAVRLLKLHPSGIARHTAFTMFGPQFVDKVLLVFLFARKLDVERTVELMENHVEFRVKHNVLHPVRFHHIDVDVTRSGTMYNTVHRADKSGRMMSYVFLANHNPKLLTAQSFVADLFFHWENMVLSEAVMPFRMGSLYLYDFKNFSIRKNMMGADKNVQKVEQELLQCMPVRLRGLLLVNAGLFTRWFVYLGRMVLKAKIVKRIKVVRQEDLHQWVEPHNLVQKIGGRLEWDLEEWEGELRSWDRKRTAAMASPEQLS